MNANRMKLVLQLSTPCKAMRQRIPIEQILVIASRQKVGLPRIRAHTPELLDMTVDQTVHVVHFKVGLVDTIFGGANEE